MPIALTELLSGRALSAGRSAPSDIPAAVLTMELQRGVMGDLASFPELAAAARSGGIVATTARLLDTARSAGMPVVHCLAKFRADRAGTAFNSPLHSAVARRTAHMLEGSAATDVVPELGPAPGDLVSERTHGVSPFTGTSLDAMLRNLGVRVLVATGVSVNVALVGLCIEAVNLGYQVAVPTDAVAGVPPDYASAVLANSIGLVATLTTVDEVIKAIDTLTGGR